MGRRVAALLALVVRRADHLAVTHDRAAHRHVAVVGGLLGLAQHDAHEVLIPRKAGRMARKYPRRVDRLGRRRPSRALEFDGRSVRSAVVKRPVARRVMMRHTNLDGDGQADLRPRGEPTRPSTSTRVGTTRAEPRAEPRLSPFGYFGGTSRWKTWTKPRCRSATSSAPRRPCSRWASHACRPPGSRCACEDHASGKRFLATGRVDSPSACSTGGGRGRRRAGLGRPGRGRLRRPSHGVDARRRHRRRPGAGGGAPGARPGLAPALGRGGDSDAAPPPSA